MAGEPLELPGQIGEDPLSAVARMRTEGANPGVDLGTVRLEDLPKRNGRGLGSITPEQLATIQLDTGLQQIGFPTTPAGLLEGLPAATPLDRIPVPEPPSRVGDRITAGIEKETPPPFNEPAPPNEGAYQVLNKRRADMLERRAADEFDQTMGALQRRLTPTEPLEGETPVYLRRLYQPTVDRVKQLWHVPDHLEVPALAGEIVEAEASYRLQHGLYSPEEARVSTFEEWAATIPPNLLQQMQADGTLARHRGRRFVMANKLKDNIREELGGGLPMYAPEAASRQDKLYTLVKDLTPEELPAAHGFLEKLAQTAGDIAPFLAELAVARRAIGLPMAKATGRAVGTGAGVEGGLGLGLAAGVVSATRGEDPVTEGAFFGALGGLHRLAPGTSKAAAVARTAGTGAAFATKTAFAGGNLEDILISGLIVPLIFHAPDLIRRPWRPRTVLNREPEAWRGWGDDASMVKKLIHRFNTMGEQVDTLSPETWNRELTQTATTLGKMYERAQKTPERFKGEELDLLQQFVNRFSEKPAPPTPTEELRTYEVDLGAERGTRRVQAGSPQEADHLGRGIAGVEYRQPREGQHKTLAEEPAAVPGTEVFRVEVSDGRRRIITARDQAEADGMAKSVFGVEVTAVIPTKQPVEEAQGLTVATAAPFLTPLGEVAEPSAAAPPPEPPVTKPAPIMQEIIQEPPKQAGIEPTVDLLAGSEAAVDSIGGAGITGPPRDTAGAMGKPLREYEGARYSVVGAEGQGWKVTDKGTGETVQVVGSREIADIIAREYNAVETGVDAAASPPEKPKIPETTPTTITVPAAGLIPGYRITRWPNGVHVVRFENKPPAEVLERIKNQGGRWHRKSKGHLMPGTFSTSQIQGVIHGTAPPPKSIDLPTPTETKGTRALTPVQAGELLAIGDNRKLVRESLRARGYEHTTGAKNEFFEHPSGEFRYRMQPRNIRKQERGPGGKGWVTTPRVFTLKDFDTSIRRALTEIQQKGPMTKPPPERPARERTKELAELRDYIGALGKRIASRTNSFGDPLADIQVQQIEELRTAAEDRFAELMRQAGRRPAAVETAPVETPTPEKPAWMMTTGEFLHPQFHLDRFKRISQGKHGDQVGTLGDYLRGEKIRALYAPVLDTPVLVIDRPVEGGKAVPVAKGTVFHGAFGTFKDKPAIFVAPGRKNSEIIKTLLEEGAHAMREAKGRTAPKQTQAEIEANWAAYKAMPHELSAGAMAAHAQSLVEKTHSELVGEAIAAGEPVPQKVREQYEAGKPAPEKPLAAAARKLTEAAGALVEAAEGSETPKISTAPERPVGAASDAVGEAIVKNELHHKKPNELRRKIVTLLRRAKEAVDRVKYDLVDTIPEPSGDDAHREINGSVGHQASQEEVGAVLEEAFNESTNLAADIWAATKALDEGLHPNTQKRLEAGNRKALERALAADWQSLDQTVTEVRRLFGWRAASDYEVLVWADQSLPIASAIQQGAQRVESHHETAVAEREGGPEAIDDADLPDPNLRATGGVRGPAVEQLIKETDEAAYEAVKAKLLEQGKPGAKAIEHMGVGHADAAEAYLVIKAIEEADRDPGIRYPVSMGEVTLPADLAGELPSRIAAALETARRSYADRLEEVETGIEGAKLWLIKPDSPKSEKVLSDFKKSQGKAGVGLGGKPRPPVTLKAAAPKPGLPRARREPLVSIQDAVMRDPGRYLDMGGVLVTAEGVFASDGRVIFNAIDIPAGLEAGHVYKLDAKGKVKGKPIPVYKGSQKGKTHAGGPWLGKDTKGEEYSSYPDGTMFFASVGPEQVFEIKPDQVAATAKWLRQAEDFKGPAAASEVAGVIGVLNTDGSLGFATAVPEVGSAELNVREDGVVLGGIAAELLRKALRFHYDVSPDSSIQVYWPEPPADPTAMPPAIRMASDKARTVVMPVSASTQNARVERLLRPGLYQADLDTLRVPSMKLYASSGFLPAFYHSETGDVVKSSTSNSWQLEGLPPSMMRAADRADLALQPGFVDKDGKFYPLADAWVGAVDQMKLPTLVKAAGLDPGSLKADSGREPTGFNADDQGHREALGKAIDALDEYRQGLEVHERLGGPGVVPSNEWHDADDALRKLIGHLPRVAGGADLFQFERAKYVAARLLRLKLAKREAVKVRGSDPDLMPQVAAKMTPEDLAYLREHGPSSPVFGMGAAPNIPDQRHWNARLYDHIANRLQHPPPGSIRDYVTKSMGRGLYNYRWAITEEEFRKFEAVKGEKRWGRMVARDIRTRIRQGVAERIKAAETKRDRPLTAPQADTLRKRYHREVEDVLRGDRPFERLDDRQKEIWKLYIRPTRYVTDYILNNEWTWPHLQAFGLKNVEEVIMIKSMGPGEYLRRLYEQTDEPFRPPPDLTERRVVNIGPRIRGGQFMPRRGDEEFTTLVDATHSPPQMQQFMDPQQARAEWERLVKANLEEYGKNVFAKIQVLDPFNVEELEQGGFLRPVRDVETLIERSIVDSLANLETLKLFQYLANAVSIPISGALPAGYRDIPNLPAYGPLRGTAVPEPTFYAIMQRESIPAHPAYQAWMIYQSAFKKSKVIYSPSTWGRNILGVTAFVYLDGNNPVKHFPLLLQALREFRNRGPNWERLVRENEINAGWSGTELEDLERYVVANVDSWPEAVIQWLDKHKDVASASARRVEGISELDRKIGQLYDLPDQVAKLWAYLIKTQTQGMSHEESLRSMWMYHNYDRAGRFARWARHSPVGEPFVMFSEQTVKIYVRALRDRMIRLALLFASMPLLTYLTRLALGVSDEQMDLINADPRRSKSWPDRFFQPLIPVRNERGLPLSVDLRWTFPLGDDFRLGNATGGWEIPFLTGQPIVSAAAEIAFNRRNWSDRALVDPKAEWYTKLWQWAVHFIDSTAPVPPLVPVIGIDRGRVKVRGGATRIFLAATGEAREGLPTAVLREVFGIRVNDPWVRRADAFQLIKDARGAGEAERYAELMTEYNELFRAEYDKPIKPRAVRRANRRDRNR